MLGDIESKRLMAIDPGSRHIGVALSDLSNTIARPFCIIPHTSREKDAKKIVQVALQHKVVKIIMGLSVNDAGNPSPTGRSARHLAEEIIKQSAIPIDYWDEDFTTNQAQDTLIQAGTSKKRRKGHQDDVAAAILLQSYIENIKNRDQQNFNEI
jgi:putative Holliday junction resolvase